MIHVGILDDNRLFLDSLQELVKAFFDGKGIACKVEGYQNPEFFYDEVLENPGFDVCFLDIEMPGMNGIELAKKLRRNGSRVELVFLTAHTEFMRLGYEVRAFDYLDKETVSAELPKVLERLVTHLEEKKKRVYTIRTAHRVERIAYEDIVYLYKSEKNTQFVLKGGKETQERITLREVLDRLNCDEFMLIEKGFIVNIEYVLRLDDGAVELVDGTRLKVGRRHINNLREKIGKYWIQKN